MNEEPKPKPAARKPYRKPKIRSARFYERKALACMKTEADISNPDCREGFNS